MRVMVYGATGMVGQGVLRECLLAPDVEKVLAVGRRPNTDHLGQFKWIAKWWGEDKNKVYSLALKISPELKGHRLTVVRAVDQDGREVEIVQHGSQDNAEQAVFLKPPPESRQFKLTFALQRSRFVQFLVRPDFVKAGPTNSPTKN